MEILNKKQRVIIIIIGIFMILFIGFYIISKTNNEEFIYLETEEDEIIDNNNMDEEKIYEEDKKIIIHVTGSIKNEGIVEAEEGARISEIIDLAGGITEEADLSKINLAYAVRDGQKIYVPSIYDKTDIEIISDDAGENVVDDNGGKAEEKVNINTASQTELETLSGIGPSTALKIINYREENGDFEKIEDIKNVPGIGEAKYESLKESICIK